MARLARALNAMLPALVPSASFSSMTMRASGLFVTASCGIVQNKRFVALALGDHYAIPGIDLNNPRVWTVYQFTAGLMQAVNGITLEQHFPEARTLERDEGE